MRTKPVPSIVTNTGVVRFQRNGIPYMYPGVDGPALTLQDSQTQTPITVPRLNSFKSHKTLGHHKALSGHSSKELALVTAKGTRLARQLFTSPATHSQASTFYWSIYLPSIRYTLPQSFFPRHQLHAAQAKSFPLILAKCGYMRTMSYDIAFGPSSLGGGGFVRWSTLQGKGQVTLFLKHWRVRDNVGRMLQIALAWAQFQAGTSQPILQDVDRRLPYLESCWIPSLRSFLTLAHARLVTDCTYIAPIQREGDEHIMDKFITLDALTDTELHILNCCRLYLDVITVSDLLDMTGRQLDSAIRRHEPSSSSTLTLHTPVQAKPAHWKLWDVLIAAWFNDDFSLRQPLGAFWYSGDKLRRRWKYYYDSATAQVYTQVVDGYVRCAPTSQGYLSQEVTDWIPTPTSTPIAVEFLSEDRFRPLLPLSAIPSPSLAPPATFSEYVHLLPSWEVDLLRHVTFLMEPFEFCHQFATRLHPDHTSNAAHPLPIDLTIVSDGSQSRDSMSFGWTFGFSDGSRIATCQGPGFGHGSSHRAKGYGILSAVCFVHHLQKFVDTSVPWAVRFISNNKGLILRLTQHHSYLDCYPASTLASDWDLVDQTIALIRLSPLNASFRHVKGHQDQTLQYNQLSLEAQMNVDADALAGFYCDTLLAEQPIVPLLPTTGVHLQIDNCTITSHYIRHIRHAVATRDYVAAMCRSNDWHPDVWTLIDQPALRRIIGRNSHRHVNVVKLIHDLLPTNAVRQYTDPHTLPKCEKCDFDKATFSHLLRCSHPSRTRWRLGLLAALRTTEERQTIWLSLLQAILTGISSWFTRDLAPTVGFSPDVAQAVHEQNEIGWYGFLRGFCSQRWAQIQQRHYSHNDLATNIINGDTWLSNMLTTIWTQLFRLWEEYIQELHGKTAAECQRQDRNNTQRQIRALHLFCPQVRAIDRQWFLPDLDHYCNTTGSHL